MAEDFAKAVEEDLNLAKRVHSGEDRAATAAPKPLPSPIQALSDWYLPSAPMVYAVISVPRIVDNPDMPSYHPHVHGRVHCVLGSRSCDSQIAVPMGSKGSILGVEVDLPRKSYSTELIGVEESKVIRKLARPQDGGFLQPHIFTLTIQQVDGGTNIGIKLRWSQKLSYNEGEFSLIVPFSFPEYVTPVVKKISKKEKIQLNVNSDIASGILCRATSHQLKETKLQAEKFSFLYDAEVLTWSNTDFSFSYSVSSGNIFGAVFKKAVVFVVDISDSMQGKALEATKTAISSAPSKLGPEDSFNIIAFSGLIEVQMQKLFSKALSTILVDRTVGAFNDNEQIEVYSSSIPDLSFESPLTICGRYRGSFPDTLEANGLLGDLSNFVMDLKVVGAKDIPLDRVTQLSIEICNISEYTRMVLLEKNKQDKANNSSGDLKASGSAKRVLLQSLSVDFGDVIATTENIRPGAEEQKLPDAAEAFMKATSDCCGRMYIHCFGIHRLP
ncbi:Trichome birefringence-like 16 [Hibiscus syriacus]|uniref:Trichome birefringence-like 16 n=1 Tax=Hibiscus syriacus TaxID=106335 RepID=A0A6A2ZAM6_HIBSY|nr:Trichome birefringence-like 16 [Hibiscus syriacus]